MCRNYRELSTAEVGEIARLYPVTPNRVIARQYDISVDALQDYLAYPNGWKKDRKAVASGQTVTACCSIGDEQVTFQYADGRRETETFADIVEMARLYILTDCGGSFERFAEWGLIRPRI